jgi:RelA/SpoT family (p)ppGpp synthetase
MEYATSILGKLPGIRRNAGFQSLAGKLDYLAEADVEPIAAAFEFGLKAHEGQTRQSGEAYIEHPVAVAGILADLHMDSQTLTAAILHDVLEDTDIPKSRLSELFGSEVSALVDGVSKLDQLSFTSRAEAQVESFRKMMLAMVEDIRVILVKLADRTHNMRTLGALPPDKQRRIALETLEIYAPIANRLGINSLKTELEELGFRYAYPMRHRVIRRTLRRKKGNQRQIVRKISARLKKALTEAGIEAEVEGREKHLFSIYSKMLRKKLSLSDIVDVYGFRIVVEDADVCYRTLGLVHQLYKPMPGRFKDYVAIPRVNGYQSLHTTLFGPNGLPLEVQIRTRNMHRVAESGIAAHWHYKDENADAQPPQTSAREWLSSISEIEMTANSEEFMESVKVDLFPDKVYVFTPKGEILRLPRGATCVDFAYAVHTDVGNRCAGARVDRVQVPMRTRLKSGQTVEIITRRDARPNPAWVNFVATAKARHSIRQYLKNLQEEEAVAMGRKLLDQALKDFGSSVRRIGRNRLRELLDEFSVDSRTQLYEQIGLGERLAPLIAQMLLQTEPRDANAETGGRSPIVIAGTEGMVVSYAGCCHPLPDDEIMGFMTAGRGVVIHRNTCGNLAEFRKQPKKWITVSWEKDIAREFSSDIRVEVRNRPGILAEVATRIADTDTNIDEVTVVDKHEDDVNLVFQLLVSDRIHLARVIRGIRAMPDVHRVIRVCA